MHDWNKDTSNGDNQGQADTVAVLEEGKVTYNSNMQELIEAGKGRGRFLRQVEDAISCSHGRIQEVEEPRLLH